MNVLFFFFLIQSDALIIQTAMTVRMIRCETRYNLVRAPSTHSNVQKKFESFIAFS